MLLIPKVNTLKTYIEISENSIYKQSIIAAATDVFLARHWFLSNAETKWVIFLFYRQIDSIYCYKARHLHGSTLPAGMRYS